MTAPTPAPVLTDEEIDELTETARADFVASAADEDEIRADHETFARWYAAVIAKAKREAAEEIAQAIEREAATLDHLPPTDDPGVADYRMGLRHGMAGSVEHDLIGAAGIARQIGATR